MQKKLTISLVTSLLLTTPFLAKDDLSSISITTATKSEQSIKDITSNISVITKTELQERNFTTVSEALNTISGISIASNGGIGQQDSLFIRGVSSKRVLILVDGIRYNEPTGLSGAPLAQLMINDVEKIEVVKGAQSGIWGADASGGVINIITTSSKKGFHGEALVEVGSFNSKKASVNLSNKSDKYFAKINVTKISTDGFSSYEPKKGDTNYGKRGSDLGLEKDGYTNTTLNLQAGAYLSKKDEWNVTYKNIDAVYDYDSSGSDNLKNESKLDHSFISSSYIHKSDDYKVNVSVKESKFDREQGDFSGTPFKARSTAKEFSILSNVSYADSSSLLIGLNKQDFEDLEKSNKYSTKAAFLSNNNKFDKLIFTQTLRHDDNDKFDKKTTGKVGIKYNFTKKLNLSSNYGTAYNAPTLGNLSYTSTLKPENTKSFDLSVNYNSFTVTYFKTEIEDMIEYVSGSYPNTQYENIDGKSKLSGYELSYKKSITDETLFNLNYTYLNAEDAAGKKLARRVKNQVNVAVDYYGFKNLHINVNSVYVGERYDKKDKQGANTGEYALLNTVVSYKINKNLKSYVKIDNITDKFYQTIDGYGTASRSAYVGLKASF